MNFQYDASLNCALDMSGSAKKEARRKSSRKDDERTLQSLKQELNKRKVGSFLHECNGNTNLKRKIVKKAIVCKTKTSKKQPSLTSLKEKLATISKKKTKTIEKKDDRDENLPNSKRRRSRKKQKNNVELDEASKLQRRTRYLLIRMKLEQNLLDAYSAEGWKGQSREKIRPEKELQRAKMQILKYKLGIREAIRQLDLLSSEGQISNSAVAPDGSVHHEHIICAKCKLREALPDNDIILCDGTCNCAFHQKCIDPPLSTENIPPGDQGWFCKFCKKKMEILEATNAHLGTHFPVDSSWEDVFKEEAALPDGGNYMSCQGDEWPSDDSEDDDYDPDRNEYSCSESASKSECGDASDCSSSFIVEERNGKSVDNSLELIGEDSDDINNVEVVSHPRQRASVDYIKLYDEMFGKYATESEQISDDEEWGPTKRKRKVKESDAASTLMTLGEADEKNSEEIASELDENRLINKMRRPIFRLPRNAVEKLRLVFAENELPARALRVSLSEQLGLEFEKVNKWFKNARYLALRARKQAERAEVSENVSPVLEKETLSETTKGVRFYRTESSENTTSPNPKSSHKFVKRRNPHLLTNSFEIKQCNKRLIQTAANSNQMSVDVGEDVSLKQLKEKAKKANRKKKSELHEKRDGFEREMERLCEMKSRVENLQQTLLQLPIRRFGNKTNSTNQSVILVPIAQLKEKT